MLRERGPPTCFVNSYSPFLAYKYRPPSICNSVTTCRSTRIWLHDCGCSPSCHAARLSAQRCLHANERLGTLRVLAGGKLMRTMRQWWTWLAAVLLAAPVPAVADSWLPPQSQTYVSAHKTARLLVQPRVVDDRLEYFQTKVAGGTLAGRQPRGLVERLVGGKWVRAWEGPLVNETAPVSALVSDDGAYAITFDNWHSMGLGDNVVVIYRRDGKVVRALALSDILPDDYVRALPRSVSSLWWSGEHRLEGGQLLLQVVVPSNSNLDAKRQYVQLAVDLASGQVAPPAGAAWERAMAAARPIATGDRAGEASQRAYLLAPLTSPTGDDQSEWSRYLYQAGARLLPPTDGLGFRPTWILPLPASAGYGARAKEIREALSGWDGEEGFALAAPAAADALAQLLRAGARAAKPGALRGVPVLVALPERVAGSARAALERLGAKATVFDPAVAIPQTPQRLAELGATPEGAAAAAAQARAEAARLSANAEALAKLAPPDPEPSAVGDTVEMEEMADRMEEQADALAAAVSSPK